MRTVSEIEVTASAADFGPIEVSREEYIQVLRHAFAELPAPDACVVIFMRGQFLKFDRPSCEVRSGKIIIAPHSNRFLLESDFHRAFNGEPDGEYELLGQEFVGMQDGYQAYRLWADRDGYPRANEVCGG